MFVETFLACLRQFYFLKQTEYSAWAIAFALWPFLAIFKMLQFFEYHLFFSSRFFFAEKISNVFVETFFACFKQFYFLNHTQYFAWAIAFAIWPFLGIFKMLSFFEYKPFFQALFCIEQL